MADKTSAKETLRQHFIEEGYSEDKNSSGRFFTKKADNGDLKRVFIAVSAVVMWHIDTQTSHAERVRFTHKEFMNKLDL